MRTSAVFFASVLAAFALLPVACTQNFGIFDPAGSSTSSGSAGTGGESATTTSTTSSSSGSSTTSGGTGGAPECMPGDACADMNPCTADACDQGKCIHPALPDGPSMDGPNSPMNCLAPACVGGVLTQVPDNTDLPVDGNNCTKDLCDNGVPSNPPEAPSTNCGPSQVCNDKGVCVGCVNSNQCADPGTCKSATCDTGVCKAVDNPPGTGCGGNKVCDGSGSCVECVSDQMCTGTKICISNACSTSCNTGVKDGTETDIDCGGLCQANCGLGKGCKMNNDCISNVCTNLKCAVPGPTCFDSMMNGGESDVDCGGPCMLKCPIGDKCGSGPDCASTVCTNNLCANPVPTCLDGMPNGMETDTDCGGPTCGPCGNTKACVASTDCLSVSCVSNVCVGTQCSDGAKNGAETATDCGGPTCTKCSLGKACVGNSDCVSNNCVTMTSLCGP
jgi:hypothetical protein